MSDEKLARAHLTPVEGFRFTVTFPGLEAAPAVAVDEAPPLGGGMGPNPAALLATAVGGCLASSLTFCLGKMRVEAPGVTADAAAHLVRNETGRFRIGGIDVTLSVAVPEGDADRLARCEELFEDFCIVTESVRHGIPVNVELRKGRLAGAEAPALQAD